MSSVESFPGMRRGSPERHGNKTGILVSAVATASIVLVILLAIVVRSEGATFEVNDLQPTACPVGGGAPVCYGIEVVNTGREPSSVRCEVTAAEGTVARFPDGGLVYTSASVVGPGDPIGLFVEVDAGDGGTIFAPSVACGSSG